MVVTVAVVVDIGVGVVLIVEGYNGKDAPAITNLRESNVRLIAGRVKRAIFTQNIV